MEVGEFLIVGPILSMRDERSLAGSDCRAALEEVKRRGSRNDETWLS